MSQKGFAPILLLLAGLGVIVFIIAAGYAPFEDNLYQVLYRKEDSKAAENIIDHPTEFGAISLADVDHYPKPVANKVQTMVFFGAHNSKTGADNISDKLDYLAKDIDYVWFDHSSFSTGSLPYGPYDFSELYSTFDILKQKNPNIKVGTHGGMVGLMFAFHIPYSYLSESDFLHYSDGTRITHAPSTTSPEFQGFLLNIGNATTREKLKNAWIDVFSKHPNIDGMTLDAYNQDFYPHEVKAGKTCQADAINCNSLSYWSPNIPKVSETIKSGLPANKDLVYNGIFDGPNVVGLYNNGYGMQHTGALAEHVYRMVISPDVFSKYVKAINDFTSGSRKVFFHVNPQLLRQVETIPGTCKDPKDYTTCENFLTRNNMSIDLNLERFYLATYLLIQKNPFTYFGYAAGAFLNGNMYFYPDWNKDFGATNGAVAGPADGNGLYLRSYMNGLVVVNPTDREIPLHLPVANLRDWDPYNGPIMAQDIKIASKSGHFYFNSRTPITSVPPSPSPSPSPSPIPTPTPSPSPMPSPIPSVSFLPVLPSMFPFPSVPPVPSPNITSCSNATSKISTVNSNTSVTWTYTYPSSTKITAANFPAKAGLKYTVDNQTAAFGQALNANLGNGTSTLKFTVTSNSSCALFTVPFTLKNSCNTTLSELVGMGAKSSYGSFCR